MALPEEDQPAVKTMTLRERGAATVRELAEVGAKLHPLKMKLQAGETFSEDEQKDFDELEYTYRELEQQMRSLMRPRARPIDAHVRGLDHLHGPDDLEV